MPAPLSIQGVGKQSITVTWEDEHVSIYPGKTLRLRCQCAYCVEEMTGRKLVVESDIPDDIRFDKIELMGTYAIQIIWSDGHATGIYTFRNLRAWCPCQECSRQSQL